VSQATHPLTHDQANFLRLANMAPGNTPVRIGVLLPFSSGSASTRALAASLMKAAELALFDSNNRDLLLISADEGSDREEATSGARSLLAQGAEVIIGPLFAQSVQAVAPIARDHAVPLISFSTDRLVAGDGVYLLSFLPGNEVRRIVSYAASQRHSRFAALIPGTAYGTRVAEAFQDSVRNAGALIAGQESFVPASADIAAPSQKVAQAKPDAILIAQGGTLLREIASTLASDGAGSQQIQYLGTGLWDDPETVREPSLVGGWFAAPDPEVERVFDAKYRAAFGGDPPALSALAYDAVSLVTALSQGTPYHRFTFQALTDPNGFSGADGIFRIAPDGTSERGLAVLRIQSGGGLSVVSPAPRTFQVSGS
jgi:ABC-type branched-subunit amino acid transport system substrate-binding protein